jgi:hypothetical protein
LAGILLNYRLFFGDCRIIHLDLLVLAARGHTSSTPGAWMQGRGLAPRPRVGTSHRRNVLPTPGFAFLNASCCLLASDKIWLSRACCSCSASPDKLDSSLATSAAALSSLLVSYRLP